ncbi:formiminotetrahydrofolate cyclodeaminase [Blastococcus colisei]|uniref:Formiminotetrahydrofolate cyclodeaminase n=1 Tax=Blastococcus colisei TaxID=1564162 RepID=A0A543PI96_9ACTN|nr:cyclodeaminase/cyclohydrolase family protein [Blastococcus colisei]TQN43806.1 formiminotetrahydrofolate cyclodeaminase [Blastococcus colisei]
MDANATTAESPTADELDGQSLGEFLGQLAARMAAPGAGATAGIEAALSASLIAMVGRFTTDEEHADVVREIVADADAQRDACLEGAAEDQQAFSAVAEAMKLPRESEEQQESRRRALSAAQLDAAQPPRKIIESAVQLASLAERLLPIANRNLISDVAAAVAAARAAASTARLAVETNLAGIDDQNAYAELSAAVAVVDDLARRADAVEAEVRDLIRR